MQERTSKAQLKNTELKDRTLGKIVNMLFSNPKSATMHSWRKIAAEPASEREGRMDSIK